MLFVALPVIPAQLEGIGVLVHHVVGVAALHVRIAADHALKAGNGVVRKRIPLAVQRVRPALGGVEHEAVGRILSVRLRLRGHHGGHMQVVGAVFILRKGTVRLQAHAAAFAESEETVRFAEGVLDLKLAEPRFMPGGLPELRPSAIEGDDALGIAEAGFFALAAAQARFGVDHPTAGGLVEKHQAQHLRLGRSFIGQVELVDLRIAGVGERFIQASHHAAQLAAGDHGIRGKADLIGKGFLAAEIAVRVKHAVRMLRLGGIAVFLFHLNRLFKNAGGIGNERGGRDLKRAIDIPRKRSPGRGGLHPIRRFRFGADKGIGVHKINRHLFSPPQNRSHRCGNRRT